MKVFYHNDMDGECAGHVINSYDDWPTPSASFQAMQYGDEFPFDEIKPDSRVYILDYSIEPAEMERLLKITENVIWIDHHKTAIEKYAEFPEEILGLRSTEMAGCCLAYQWVWKNRSPYDRMLEKIPRYVKLVGDRDTWAFEYGDTTRHFFAGMQAEDTFSRAPIWDELRWDEDLDTLNATIKNGILIQRYKDRTRQAAVRENGWWLEFHGYRCYAVNGGRGSEPFEAVVPEAEIWIAFSYMPAGFWTVSLYSDKVDVSEIAKQYEFQGKGGGGHKGASGFQCAYPPFLPKPQDDGE